jgi:hypothetical protein
VSKHDDVMFDNVFAGDQPSVYAATYVAAPIAALLGNDFEKVDIESVDLAISSAEETRRRRSSGSGWTIRRPGPCAPWR